MALSSWTDQQVIDQLDSGYKWTGSTITYAFPTSASATYTGGGEGGGFQPLTAQGQAAAELALRLWDDLISPDMVKVAAGSSWSSQNIEFGLSTTNVSYAHAYYPTVGSVWFNSTYTGGNSLVSPVVGQHGFLTYVHEIGHSLGLDHMGDYNGSADTPSSYQDSTVYSVMSYFGPSWGSGSANGEGLVAWADWVGADGRLYSPQTPMLNDIMAIQSMYGVETTTRTENTVYGFNSTVTGSLASIYDFTINKNPILCIFDSAGVDTLDLSGWNTGSVINIASGGFCSANSMTYNISIAYTCEMENAIGGAGADSISGNGLANMLKGGAGNDRIFGFAGNDRIYGNAGNDYIDGGDGVDYVYFDALWSAITYTYDAVAATFTFTNFSTGSDTVLGVEYFVDAGNVVHSVAELTGAPAPDPGPAPGPTPVKASIVADAASILEGSAGSSVYTFTVNLSAASTTSQTVQWSLLLGSGTTAANASDFTGATSGTVTFAAGQTTAKIAVSVIGDTTSESDESFSVVLSNPTSGLSLDVASATGVIRNDDGASLTGTSGSNTLNGTALNDSLYGLGGNDTLNGYAGDDLLDGGTGSDRMSGGAGNDTYVIDNRYDTVVENAGEGTDTIRTSLTSYTLGANVENLTYTGVYNFVGTGNAAANAIYGSSGADRLNGMSGSDVLFGGAGSDTFDFTTALGAANVDTILDFNTIADTIRLENSVFTAFGLTTGTLSSAAFVTGTAAADASDRIIFDSGTGSLYYDPDGIGAAAQIKFATLTNVTGTLTAADFLII